MIQKSPLIISLVMVLEGQEGVPALLEGAGSVSEVRELDLSDYAPSALQEDAERRDCVLSDAGDVPEP